METTEIHIILLYINIFALLIAGFLMIKNHQRQLMQIAIQFAKSINQIESDVIKKMMETLTKDRVIEYGSFDPNSRKFKYTARIFKWYHISEYTPKDFIEDSNASIYVIADTPYGIHECLYHNGYFYPPSNSDFDFLGSDLEDLNKYSSQVEWWMGMPSRDINENK